MPDEAFHRGEIEEALINRSRQQCRRIPLHHAKHLARYAAVIIVVRLDQNTVWTKPLGLEASRTGADTVTFGLVVGSDDDAITGSPATDPYRPTGKRGVHRYLATGKKSVSVDVKNAQLLSLGHSGDEYRNPLCSGQLTKLR